MPARRTRPERRRYYGSICTVPDCDELAKIKHGYQRLCSTHWLAAFFPAGGSSSASLPPPTIVPRPCQHAFRWTCAACGVDERTPSTTRLVQLADACRVAGHATVPVFETLPASDGQPSNV